jgi:hypothetical protein
MSSLAREFNQDNLVVVKKIDFKFIEEEIQKGTFGLEARNADFKGDRVASVRKTEDGKILNVEPYEPIKKPVITGLIHSVTRNIHIFHYILSSGSFFYTFFYWFV